MLLPRLLMLHVATVTIKHYKQTPGNISYAECGGAFGVLASDG